MKVAISAGVQPDNPEQAAKAIDLISLMLVGLAMEGISCGMSVVQYEEIEVD